MCKRGKCATPQDKTCVNPSDSSEWNHLWQGLEAHLSQAQGQGVFIPDTCTVQFNGDTDQRYWSHIKREGMLGCLSEGSAFCSLFVILRCVPQSFDWVSCEVTNHSACSKSPLPQDDGYITRDVHLRLQSASLFLLNFKK